MEDLIDPSRPWGASVALILAGGIITSLLFGRRAQDSSQEIPTRRNNRLDPLSARAPLENVALRSVCRSRACLQLGDSQISN
jgi:hypothetical protein